MERVGWLHHDGGHTGVVSRVTEDRHVFSRLYLTDNFERGYATWILEGAYVAPPELTEWKK